MQRRKSIHKKAQTARFNLLLLEDGEYFLEDFSAYRYMEPSAASHRRVHGRIKVCTRGLFFVPDDLYLPILRFPFRAMRAEPMAECFVDQDSAAMTVMYLTFQTKQVVEMKTRGIDHPYIYKDTSPSDATVAPDFAADAPSKYLFTLLYSSIEAFLANIHVIYEVASLPRRAMTKTDEEALLAPVLAPRLLHEFDPSLLVDFREKLVLPAAQPVERIEPLLRYPGCIMLTDQRLYFQPAQLNNVLDPVLNWEYTKIEQVYRRRYLLRQTGLEVCFKKGDSSFFSFSSQQDRDNVYNEMVNQPELLRCRRTDLEHMMRKWQRREISNFEYLWFLNNASGRTKNDLTQYPVFPWILSDYTSAELDLANPSVYRDLSKPVGALNPERLEFFKTRYEVMPDGDEVEGMPPPFLYGTHYSTPGYVLYFLVRMAPEYMLCLQNGKFDAPDRLFRSIRVAWEGCLQSHTDVKELIPEFFEPNFPSDKWLRNLLHLDLGTTQGVQRVDDVELPPWANGDPYTFVLKNREALESEHVSKHLHEWIDLIFGYKQRGEEAVAANNVFYYLSYEGAVDVEAVDDPMQKSSLESQIQEFGQTPKLLFSTPHPPRFTNEGKIKLATPDLIPSPRVLLPQVQRRSYHVEADGTFSMDAVRRRLQSSPFDEEYDTDDDDAVEVTYQQRTGHQYSFLCLPNSWSKVPVALGNIAGQMWSYPGILGYGSRSRRWHWKARLMSKYGLSPWWSWKQASPIQPHCGEVTCAVLSNTDGMLFTTSKDCTFKMTDVREGTVVREFACESALSCCDVAPDGQFAFLGCWDNRVYMYSIATGAVIDKLFAHSDGISAIRVTRSRLLTSSWDSTIKLWSYTDTHIVSSVIRTFMECNDSVLCLAVSSDGLYGAAGVRNGHVYLFDLSAADLLREVHVSPRRQGDIASISFSANCKSVVCMTIENELIQVSLQGELLWTMDCNTAGQIRCFDSDGDFAVGGTTNGKLLFWGLRGKAGREVVYTIPEAHESSISALAVSASGSTVVTGAVDGSVHVWKLEQTGLALKHQASLPNYREVATSSASIQETRLTIPRKSRKSTKKHRNKRPPYQPPAFYVPELPAQVAEAQFCLEM